MSGCCKHVIPVAAFISVLVIGALTWIISYFFDHLNRLESSLRALNVEGFLEDPTSAQKIPLPSLFSPPEKYLSLVIPAYEEEARLATTLEETITYFGHRQKLDNTFTYEVLVVDDGSRDETVATALHYVTKYGLDNVRVVRQLTNQGKGAAVRKGVLCSRGKIILFADADGATKISDLEKLEAELAALSTAASENPPISGSGPKGPLELEKEFAIFGSRAHLEAEALAKRKWYRNFLMHGFHFCVLLAAGSHVKDTQCGFKLFTRAAARKLFTNQRLNRWCFDVELVYLCKQQGIPVKEVSVNWAEIPGSKVKLTSIVHMLFELALIRVGYSSGVWRVR